MTVNEAITLSAWIFLANWEKAVGHQAFILEPWWWVLWTVRGLCLLSLNSIVWGIYASWYMSLLIHHFFFFSFIVLIFHFTKLHLFAVPRLKDCGLSQYKLTFLILKGSFLVAETVDVKLVQISPLFLRLNVPEHFPRFLNL